MSNTSFHFRHTFLLPTRSSQSNVTSCLCLMSHHRVNNKCNRIKGRRWRWLFYALRNFLLRNNMFRVFKSNRHCSWKFRKFHRKTPVLESPQNYEIIWRRSVVMNKPYFCRNFFLIDWCHKRVKNTIDLLLFYGEHFVDFWKMIFENADEKYSFHNKHIFIYGSHTFWSFVKFHFVHIVKVCFVFKKQSLCLYSSVYA